MGHLRVRSAAMTRIRVVIAEDHQLLREGISRLVAAADDLELAGTAGDLPELLALIDRERPALGVTDLRMPPPRAGQPIENREASIPSPGHQRYVFRPAMVMIVGDVAGLP